MYTYSYTMAFFHNVFMNRMGPTDAPTAAAGDPDTHKIKIQGELKPISCTTG